jgi:hypothetical protein
MGKLLAIAQQLVSLCAIDHDRERTDLAFPRNGIYCDLRRKFSAISAPRDQVPVAIRFRTRTRQISIGGIRDKNVELQCRNQLVGNHATQLFPGITKELLRCRIGKEDFALRIRHQNG